MAETKRQNRILYFIFSFIVFGLLLRNTENPGGNVFLLIGLLIIFVSFSIKIFKNFSFRKQNNVIVIHKLMIVLMSIIFFSKYLYHSFGDYPGLLIVPIFISTSVIYILKVKKRDRSVVFITALYILLTIPLFAFDFYKSPTKYFPQEWYKRYNISKSTSIDVPYNFKYFETKELNILAFELKQSTRYMEAITLYNEARTLEPDNPYILFDMSDAYAYINDLETAIMLLDTAISIDSAFAFIYNNRGRLHSKTKNNYQAIIDYTYAIKLNSDEPIFYGNLATALFKEEYYEKACIVLKKAKDLGYDVKRKEFRRIWRKCKY